MSPSYGCLPVLIVAMNLICIIRGHDRRVRVYPPGLIRCKRCKKRWHGIPEEKMARR